LKLSFEIFLDLRLSLCCECCILSFAWFPDAWILCTDVSEDSVCSIFTGCENKKNYCRISLRYFRKRKRYSSDISWCFWEFL